jgi:hypothetical protein
MEPRAVGAGEHAGELGDGLPPGGHGDDQEDQVGGVEVVVEEANSTVGDVFGLEGNRRGCQCGR